MTEEQKEDENSVGMEYSKERTCLDCKHCNQCYLQRHQGSNKACKDVEDFTYEELSDEQQEKAYDFKKGAEFGYNKCKEELNQKGLALQSDMDKTIEQNIALKKELDKATEWHYVSKEGFPNKDDIYLIIRNDGLHLGDYCCGGDGDIDCQSWCDYPSEEEIQDDSVIAWKEIVLPELKESE